MTPPAAPSRNLAILIIGAGFIAREYIKALHALGYQRIGIVSRRLTSAQALADEFQISEAYGAAEETLPSLIAQYDAFIVASPIETLPNYAELLAKHRAPRVLLEKPSFLSSSTLTSFLQRYPDWNAVVALNRLYYPSVEFVRQTIAKEGVTSASFSFTEWVHRVDPAMYSARALERWGLSNCIHIIATVFDLIGLPAQCHATQQGTGRIVWHPAGSIFTGSGISNRDVPFTYHSDWESAGRWAITINTTAGSYSLCPIEGVEFTKRGTVEKQTMVAPWAEATKCGFEPMLHGWLSGSSVFTLSQLLPHMQAIESMFGYPADEVVV